MGTLYSSTGAAPIEFENRNDGTLGIYLEDGSGQIYKVQDLLLTLMNMGLLPSMRQSFPC